MKQSVICIFLSCTLVFSACASAQVSVTPPDESGNAGSSDSSSAPTSASSSPESEESQAPYMPPDKAPERESTDAWKTAAELTKKYAGWREVEALAVSSKNGESQTGDGITGVDKNAYWVEPGNKNSVYCTFYFKYPETVLKISPLTDKNGDPYFPGEDEFVKKGEPIYTKTDMNGFAAFWIPYLQKQGPDGYDLNGNAYVVDILWDSGSAAYYPVAPMTSMLRNYDVAFMCAEEDMLGNEVSEISDKEALAARAEQREAEQREAEQREAERRAARDIVLPREIAFSVRREPEETEKKLIAGLDMGKVSLLLGEYTKNAGADAGLAVQKEEGAVFTDSAGRHFFSRSGVDDQNKFKQAIIMFDLKNGEYTLLDNWNTPYSAFEYAETSFYSLPQSGWFLQVGKTPPTSEYYIPPVDYHLVAVDSTLPGFPVTENRGPITWLFLQTPDQSNPKRSLLFGMASEIEPWREEAAPVTTFIALQQDGERFTRWIMNKKISGNDSYYFPKMILLTIAGTDDSGYVNRVEPYTASFSGNGERVDVRFPTSCTSFRFDFNNFTITYSVNYNEEFLKQESSSYVCSSADNRFEIWLVNERHWYEATGYYYGLYDTYRKTFTDFGKMDSDLRLSFFDPSHLALIETHINETAKETVSQSITLYNLYTGAMTPLYLNLGDLTHSHWLWSVLWDNSTRQYVLTSTPRQWEEPIGTTIFAKDAKNFEDYSSGVMGGYYVSYFSPNGGYLGSHRTGVDIGGGKGSFYPRLTFSLGQGKILLGSSVLDTKTGEVRQDVSMNEVMPAVYLRETKRRLDAILKSNNPNEYSTLERLIGEWASAEPQCVDAFRYLLAQTGRMSEEMSQTFVLLPKEGMVIFPRGGYYFLGGDGQAPGEILTAELPDRLSNLCPIVWDTSDGERFLVTPREGEKKYSFSVWHWDKVNLIFNKVSESSFSPILPLPVYTNNSEYGIIFNSLRFAGCRAEPSGDAIHFYYMDDAEGKEKPFLHLLYSDGYFRLI